MQKPFIPAAVSIEALEAVAAKAHIRDDARKMLATGGKRFIDFVIANHREAMANALLCGCPEHIARFHASQDVLNMVAELSVEMGII